MVRRGVLDVSDLAVAKLVDEDAAVDSDLVELTSAAALPLADVDDHLVSLAERFPAVEEETAVRRWLLASLIDLDRADLGEDVVLACLQKFAQSSASRRNFGMRAHTTSPLRNGCQSRRSAA